MRKIYLKKSSSSRSQEMNRKFYRLHRILGLIALIPVIFWTMSGLSHPFMSNWFRPFIAQEVYRPPSQKEMLPGISLQEVMDKNNLKELRNFTLVNFDKQTYYQIQGRDSINQYYSATDGSLLPNGDAKYAVYLARYFTQDQTSGVKEVRLQTSFDGNYQPINHLLPVWKVSFARPDAMDVYIETPQSRLGTFNNTTRKCFLWIFRQFHNWQFLYDIGGEKFRIVILLIIATAMLLSLLSGLTVYGLYWNKFKQVQQKRKAKSSDDKRFVHRFHRQIGLIVSLVMFTFVVSGGFHLAVKLHNLKPEKAEYSQLISRSDLNISNLKLPAADSIVKRVSMARFNDKTYFQLLNDKKETLYFDASTGVDLKNGDEAYAIYLADYYRDVLNPEIEEPPKASLIKQFDNEYGFIDKRLPVEKISYPGNENW